MDAALAPTGSRETVSSPPRARARRTCPRARGGGGDERDSGSNAARIPLSNPANRETREDETGDLGPGEGDLEGCRQPSGKKPSGECDLRRDPRPSPLTRARLGSETRVSRTTRTPSAYDGTPRPGTDERAPRVAVHNGPMRSDSKQTTHSSVRSPACDGPTPSSAIRPFRFLWRPVMTRRNMLSRLARKYLIRMGSQSELTWNNFVGPNRPSISRTGGDLRMAGRRGRQLRERGPREKRRDAARPPLFAARSGSRRSCSSPRWSSCRGRWREVWEVVCAMRSLAETRRGRRARRLRVDSRAGSAAPRRRVRRARAMSRRGRRTRTRLRSRRGCVP